MTKRSFAVAAWLVMTASAALSGCSSADSGSEGKPAQTEEAQKKRCTLSDCDDPPPDYSCPGVVDSSGECRVYDSTGYWFTYNGCAPRRSYCNAFRSCWCY